MKCDKCGREHKNNYKFNGKNYGYNCYREIIALYYADINNKKAELEKGRMLNLLNMKPEDNFSKNCFEFYNEKGFLSPSQVSILVNKLSKVDEVELKIKDILLEDSKEKYINNRIYVEFRGLGCDIVVKAIKNVFISNIISDLNLKVIEYKDIDEDFMYTRIVNEKDYQREVEKVDEYTEFFREVKM